MRGSAIGRLGDPFADELPVRNRVDHAFDVARSLVLIVEIVRVLPHIAGPHGIGIRRQRIVRIVCRHDVELACFEYKPCPAAAEMSDRGLDEALTQIEEAVNLDPSDASLVVRAGEMLQAVGAAEKALARADLAIRLDPKLGSAWALRGRVYWQMGERDRALADLQRALHFAPDNPDLLQDVAMLYRQRGQPARVHRIAEPRRERSSEPAQLTWKAWAAAAAILLVIGLVKALEK